MAKHVTIIEGEMGCGKTNTAVGLLVDKYQADPTIKIYTNFHLYGIKYVYKPSFVEIMMDIIQKDLKDCVVIIDEAGNEGEARRSMSSATIAFTQMLQQMRKRKIDLTIIVQNSRFLDWRIIHLRDTRILCSYNEETNYIRVTVKDERKGKEKTFSYWAPQYWKYYDTDEPPNLQRRIIEKALEEV